MPRPRRNDAATAVPPAAGPLTQPVNATVSAPETPDPQLIARRAYELYEKRGGEHGRHEDDWLEAERELTRRDRA